MLFFITYLIHIKDQSKGLANNAIKEILGLHATKKLLQDELQKLDDMLLSGVYSDDLEIGDILEFRKSAIGKMNKIDTLTKDKRDILGIKGQANLKRLVNNKFLQARMNARALKHRIRARLRSRKFELTRLERAYRHTTSNGMYLYLIIIIINLQQSIESKLHEHISSQVKRHEPGIMQLCKKYNDLCADMSQMIEKKQAPINAVAPLPIIREGLFKLDVDDDIWQDIGLDDVENMAFEPIPNWLGDEQTRKGVKAIVELDRCIEEECRLSRERCAMQEWIVEEWKIAVAAYNDCGTLMHFKYVILFC